MNMRRRLLAVLAVFVCLPLFIISRYYTLNHGAVVRPPVTPSPVPSAAPPATPSPPVDETQNAEFYYNRGYEFYNKQDYDTAIADYTEAIRLNPNQAYVYTNRGNAYKAKGDTARANADYAEAARLRGQ
jgi:tetratricopeptide (TPR) repeat protein